MLKSRAFKMKLKHSIAAFQPSSNIEVHCPLIWILYWLLKKNQTCVIPLASHSSRLHYQPCSPAACFPFQFIGDLCLNNFASRDAVSFRIGSERAWGDANGFPWSPILQSMLSECFRLHSFRPGQLEAINCVRNPHFLRTILVIFHFSKAFLNLLFLCLQVLSGNDVFLVMAAGAGKSLVCVQMSSPFTFYNS